MHMKFLSLRSMMFWSCTQNLELWPFNCWNRSGNIVDGLRTDGCFQRFCLSFISIMSTVIHHHSQRFLYARNKVNWPHLFEHEQNTHVDLMDWHTNNTVMIVICRDTNLMYPGVHFVFLHLTHIQIRYQIAVHFRRHRTRTTPWNFGLHCRLERYSAAHGQINL